MMTNLLHGAHVANKLFSTIARLRLLLVMFLTLTVTTNAWAEESVVYTLTPDATGDNGAPHNSYTAGADFTCDKITWNITGNSYMVPWRIGGKSLTEEDRALYSKTPISNNISKIIIEHGTASSITVNSVKLFVSTQANGTGTIISELSNSFTASSTMTFTRPDGKDWTNAYYKIVYNVTVSSSKNKYLEFTNALFYSAGGNTPDPIDPEVTFSNGEYTVGGAALNLSTLLTTNSTGAVTYSVTNAGSTGATINGTSFTATAAGQCTVQASQAATATHNAATATATITVSAPAGGGGEGECSWKETAIGNIEDDDIVVITMTTSGGTTYAMSNNNGTSAPAATTVTVSGSTLTSDIADYLKWNITNNAGSLTIYPNGTTSTWLYCTNTNNGVKVGTGTAKEFTINDGYLYTSQTTDARYVGVYTTNPDWRCYENTTGNIAGQTLKFYVQQCTTQSTN